jgi:hypothetical protein
VFCSVPIFFLFIIISKKDIEYALMLLTIQELNDPFDSFNDDELDNNNDLIKEILLALSSSRYLASRNHIPKSKHWYYEILPLYDDIRFKKVLRMERQQFNKLVQVLQNDTVFQNKGNKPQAPVEFQLVILLRRLGSKDDILSICSRFGISEGTVILYINRVMKAIRNKKSEFVQWPKNNNRATVHAGFQAIEGFQNVIGAIDGTHFILMRHLYKIQQHSLQEKKDTQFNVKELLILKEFLSII